MRAFGGIVWIVLGLLAGGCGAASYARGGDALRPDGQPVVGNPEPYGHTVAVEREGGLWRGELIGCDRDGLYLLLHEPLSEPELYLRWDEFDGGEIQPEDDGRDAFTGGFIGWSVANALLSPTHGMFIVVSGPVAVVSGLAVTLGHAYGPDTVSFDGLGRGHRCCGLLRWSRFPQGVPPSIAARYRYLGAEPPERLPMPECPPP